MSALLPSGKPPATRVRRLISRLGRSIMLFVRMRLRCPSGILGQQTGRRLPDSLPQAVRRGLQPPAFHLPGDRLGLGQRGFPAFHGEYRLQGGGRPFAVARRRLREHVAHETRHAPLVLRLRQHRADRGDEPGAPVADHEPDAFQTRSIMSLTNRSPAGPVLLHVLRHADDLAVDADGDQYADVLDRAAP